MSRCSPATPSPDGVMAGADASGDRGIDPGRRGRSRFLDACGREAVYARVVTITAEWADRRTGTRARAHRAPTEGATLLTHLTWLGWTPNVGLPFSPPARAGDTGSRKMHASVPARGGGVHILGDRPRAGRSVRRRPPVRQCHRTDGRHRACSSHRRHRIATPRGPDDRHRERDDPEGWSGSERERAHGRDRARQAWVHRDPGPGRDARAPVIHRVPAARREQPPGAPGVLPQRNPIHRAPGCTSRPGHDPAGTTGSWPTRTSM